MTHVASTGASDICTRQGTGNLVSEPTCSAIHRLQNRRRPCGRRSHYVFVGSRTAVPPGNTATVHLSLLEKTRSPSHVTGSIALTLVDGCLHSLSKWPSAGDCLVYAYFEILGAPCSTIRVALVLSLSPSACVYITLLSFQQARYQDHHCILSFRLQSNLSI